MGFGLGFRVWCLGSTGLGFCGSSIRDSGVGFTFGA